jgi:hypothetical protein
VSLDNPLDRNPDPLVASQAISGMTTRGSYLFSTVRPRKVGPHLGFSCSSKDTRSAVTAYGMGNVLDELNLVKHERRPGLSLEDFEPT